MTLPAIPNGFAKAFAAAGIITTQAEGFGPHGFRVVIGNAATGMEGSVIVTQSDHPDTGDVEWLHASLAWADEDPTYDDLTVLHAAVFGRRRWAYQVFTPASDHVNLHPHALHLFGRVDGAPVLPDFTMGMGSI